MHSLPVRDATGYTSSLASPFISKSYSSIWCVPLAIVPEMNTIHIGTQHVMRPFVYFYINNTCFDIQLLLLFMCVCVCGEVDICMPQHTWVGQKSTQD